MDADLGGGVVVRSESNRSALLPRDLLTPADDERRNFGKVRAMDVAGQRLEVVKSLFRYGERKRFRLRILL